MCQRARHVPAGSACASGLGMCQRARHVPAGSACASGLGMCQAHRPSALPAQTQPCTEFIASPTPCAPEVNLNPKAHPPSAFPALTQPCTASSANPTPCAPEVPNVQLIHRDVGEARQRGRRVLVPSRGAQLGRGEVPHKDGALSIGGHGARVGVGRVTGDEAARPRAVHHHPKLVAAAAGTGVWRSVGFWRAQRASLNPKP